MTDKSCDWWPAACQCSAELKRLTDEIERFRVREATAKKMIAAHHDDQQEIARLKDANRMLAEEREAWKARAQEESAENDQWQRKLAEVWAEVKALREASAEWQRIHGDDVHHACRTEVERLQAGLQDAVSAIDWMMSAQQPLSDAWFEQRDHWISRAREARSDAR